MDALSQILDENNKLIIDEIKAIYKGYKCSEHGYEMSSAGSVHSSECISEDENEGDNGNEAVPGLSAKPESELTSSLSDSNDSNKPNKKLHKINFRLKIAILVIKALIGDEK